MGEQEQQEPTYELRVSNEPDESGDYCAGVYLDGWYLKGHYDRNRDEAIRQARKFVEWHRDHDATEEIIRL